MEMIITPAYATNPQVHMTHKGATVSLATSTLMRTANAANYKALFYHLNWYFSTCNEDVQAKIFAVYSQAEELLRKNDDMPTVEANLRELFSDLVELMDSEQIYNWFRRPEVYSWPSARDLPRSFDNAGSPKYPEEKTYILSEYQQLFSLILILRACVPIWAAFLDKFPKRISNEYRDMILVGMLTSESTISESPAWKRLTRYISACLGSKEENYTAGVIHGISADDFPRWVLCQALMRKLSLQPLKSAQEGDASPFVIKHLSNHIRECLQKNPTTFATPRLKTVNNREDPTNGDNDRSLFEANRVKESVARGDRWTIQIYLENPMRALQALEPDIDMGLASAILQSFNNESYVPTSDQLLIALWVCSPIVSPRSEDDLTRLNSLTLCSIAAAVLWHRGHKEVATLLACEQGAPITRGGLGTATGIRLPRDTYAKLAEIYPHADKPKNSGSAYTPVRDIVTSTIISTQSHMWNTCLPPQMLEEVKHLFPDGSNTTLRVAQNMLTELIDVVIDIAQRPLAEDAVGKADRIAAELNLPNHPVPWPAIVPEHRPLEA